MRGSWNADDPPPNPEGLRERLIITGGAVVAILSGLIVGMYLADYVYQ